MFPFLLLAFVLLAPPWLLPCQIPFPKHIGPVKYPLLARLGHMEGMIIAHVVLNSDGKVATVSASGHPVLVDAVQRWIKNWTFEMCNKNTTDIAVKFKLVGEPRTPSVAETLVIYDLPDKVTIISQPPVCDHCKPGEEGNK